MITSNRSSLAFLGSASVAALSLLLLSSNAVQAQTITNQASGVLQNDGTYLWQYTVTSGSRPALSHWTLSLCSDWDENFWDSEYVTGSATYDILGDDKGAFNFSSSDVAWVDSDPTTGAHGIKFDRGFGGNEAWVVSFRLESDWEDAVSTAVFKSGNVAPVTQSIVAPGCDLNTTVTTTNTIPEKGTVELALAALLPLAGIVARRRKRAVADKAAK